jgi:hypothetical protein
MELKKENSAVDEEELKAAEDQAAEDLLNYGDTYTHTLAKPFEYDGATFNELTFDWGKLTGRDSLAIEHEIEAMGKALIAPEFSGDYLIRMAARACTATVELPGGKKTPLSSDAFQHLPLRDWNRIRRAARSFLLG